MFYVLEQICWQGKAQNSSPILRCTFLARRSAKLIANFSATMVTSLPSFSLSLSLCISLSLSLSLSHRMYLTHNIGSASALPIINKKEKNITRRTDCAHALFDFFITLVFSVLSQDSPVKHPHKTHAMLIPPPPKKKKKLEAQHGTCFNLSF